MIFLFFIRDPYLFRPTIRQRLDPTKIDYFINWITESNLLISIPWGNTNLKLDNGEVISIPRQILQAQPGAYRTTYSRWGVNT